MRFTDNVEKGRKPISFINISLKVQIYILHILGLISILSLFLPKFYSDVVINVLPVRTYYYRIKRVCCKPNNVLQFAIISEKVSGIQLNCMVVMDPGVLDYQAKN